MGFFALTHPGTIAEARELLQQCHVQHLSLSLAALWQPPTLQMLSQLSIPMLPPSLPFPPLQDWYRPSLCPSPAPQCEGKPVLARQGKELFS